MTVWIFPAPVHRHNLYCILHNYVSV